jgi:hypothetical protein
MIDEERMTDEARMTNEGRMRNEARMTHQPLLASTAQMLEKARKGIERMPTRRPPLLPRRAQKVPMSRFATSGTETGIGAVGTGREREMMTDVESAKRMAGEMDAIVLVTAIDGIVPGTVTGCSTLLLAPIRYSRDRKRNIKKTTLYCISVSSVRCRSGRFILEALHTPSSAYSQLCLLAALHTRSSAYSQLCKACFLCVFFFDVGSPRKPRATFFN